MEEVTLESHEMSDEAKILCMENPGVCPRCNETKSPFVMQFQGDHIHHKYLCSCGCDWAVQFRAFDVTVWSYGPKKEGK